MNKKGFTLIELLAVIIILGVLLIIAIPSMNNIIEGSKKDAFVSAGKSYIQAVRYEALQGNYELPGLGEFTAVATKNIKLESGSSKSPYDQAMNDEYTYVLIINKNGEYKYYYQAVDAKNNGTNGLVQEDALERDSIIKSTADDVAKSLTSIASGITIDSVDYTANQIVE